MTTQAPDVPNVIGRYPWSQQVQTSIIDITPLTQGVWSIIGIVGHSIINSIIGGNQYNGTDANYGANYGAEEDALRRMRHSDLLRRPQEPPRQQQPRRRITF